MKKIIIIILVSAGILTSYSYAAASAPYTVDAYTLHLYHFDGNADDAVTSSPINLTLAYGATVTETSYTNFGTALNTYEGTSGTGNMPIAYADEKYVSNFVGADGAFTFEAIIRPAGAITAIPNSMQIISGENEDPSRGWQFRVNTSRRLEFIYLTGAEIHFTFPIPTTGENAWVANEWYHVAVTYNGQENTPGNLKFYWTRLDLGGGEAVLLASFQMAADLGNLPVDFAVGNDGRNATSENFEGLVDEARISSIARAPTDMLFVSGPPTAVFVTHPSDTTVSEPQAALFQTIFESESTPVVKWFKSDPLGDIEMNPNDPDITVAVSYDSGSQQYTATLTISNTSILDAGTYYCRVRNDSGVWRTSNSAELLVQGLVAHWPLDQAHYDGANYLDVVEEIPAAVAGTPVFVTGVDGTENGAVQITPESGWATVSLFDPIRQSGQLTVSFWAYWSEAPGTQQDLWANDQSQGRQPCHGKRLKSGRPVETHLCRSRRSDGILLCRWDAPGPRAVAVAFRYRGGLDTGNAGQRSGLI